jgi:hypothetical protein
LTATFGKRKAERVQTRRLQCARCGISFDCALDGGCWCAVESFRLPMPDATAEDCLCPTCLRAKAADVKARREGLD